MSTVKLLLLLFAASAVAELDLVKVKGRKYKPFATPKYCISRSIPFAGHDEYSGPRTINVYDQLLRCNEDPTCLGIGLGGLYTTSFSIGKTRINPTEQSYDARAYVKIDGETCPEGSVPYEPPEDYYSKNFCKYKNKACVSEKMSDDGPVKAYNADSCLKKCIALPECTGVNFLENKAVTKRCELLQGHCTGTVIREFYGGTHYRRLEHWREAECSSQADVSPYCEEGDVEIASDTFKENGGRNPTAQCPENHVITRCECSLGRFGASCQGVKLTDDMSGCTALRDTKAGHIRARVCCRPVKENVVPYYVYKLYDNLVCPEKTVAHCVVRKDGRGMVPTEGLQMISASDSRLCNNPAYETDGSDELEAVCLATYEMTAYDARECLEQETVASGGPEVTCEEGWYVSHCVCEGDQCTGTSSTTGAKTCTAYGKPGAQVKARACCAKLGDREDAVVMSAPESGTSRAPYVDCPYKTSLVTCLVTSTTGSRTYADGSRCWTPYSCLDCRVQAICTRQLPAPEGPFKCADGEREVVGGKLEDDSMRYSKVSCAEDEFMTRCGTQEPEDGKSCFNVGIERPHYARFLTEVQCSVYGGKCNARACCRPSEEGVGYDIISAPGGSGVGIISYAGWWNDYANHIWGEKAPSASCRDGYEIAYCNLYKTPADAFPNVVPIIEGNRCFVTELCTKCAIDLVCKTKKTVEKDTEETVPAEDDECGQYETEVFGEDVFDEFAISEASCPEGRYVSRCEAVTRLDAELVGGVVVSKDGRTCRAKVQKSSMVEKVENKARACCKKLKANESVVVVSDPDRMYETWRYPRLYLWSGYSGSARVTCPRKTELVTCLADGGGNRRITAPTAKIVGNTCSATDYYDEYGVMAICKGRKRWIEKLQG